MCNKAADDFLPALKFVPDSFVISKMIEKLYAALYADDGLLFFDEDSSNIIFCSDEMGILRVNLNNINHDDTNYEENDPDSVIHVRLLAWHSKFGKRKALKKPPRITAYSGAS